MGIATMDSPLGRIPGFYGIYYALISHTYQAQCKVLASKHLVLQSLADLVHLFPDGNTAIPFGGKDNLMSVVTGGDATNQREAQAAVRHYIDVLTIGNGRDYTFNFNACPGYSDTPDSRFLGSQWIADQGNDSHLYARVITEGNQTAPISGKSDQPRRNIPLSRSSDSFDRVEPGKNPAALPVAPIGP